MCCGSVTDWRLQRPSGRRWCGRSGWTPGRCDTSPRPFTSWSRPTAWKPTRQRYSVLFLTSLNIQHQILYCCIVRLNVWPFCTCSWATCWPGARWPPAWPCPTSPGSILPIPWRPSLPSEFSDHTLRYCQQQTLCLLISLSQCTKKVLSLQHEFLFFMMWTFEYIKKRLIYNLFFCLQEALLFYIPQIVQALRYDTVSKTCVFLNVVGEFCCWHKCDIVLHMGYILMIWL